MNDKKYIENFNHESYENRTKNYFNISEDRFVQYCISRGFMFRKLGLNCVNDSQSFAESIIPMFSKLPTLIKAFPDYFVYSPKKKFENESDEKTQFFVELKNATNGENGKTLAKIKVRDIKRYIYFEQSFTNYHTRFTLCFPLADKIIFKSVDQILKLLPKSQLKSFPNDSIEYFEVQLN
jgi:hypothetical protein